MKVTTAQLDQVNESERNAKPGTTVDKSNGALFAESHHRTSCVDASSSSSGGLRHLVNTRKNKSGQQHWTVMTTQCGGISAANDRNAELRGRHYLQSTCSASSMLFLLERLLMSSAKKLSSLLIKNVIKPWSSPYRRRDGCDLVVRWQSVTITADAPVTQQTPFFTVPRLIVRRVDKSDSTSLPWYFGLLCDLLCHEPFHLLSTLFHFVVLWFCLDCGMKVSGIVVEWTRRANLRKRCNLHFITSQSRSPPSDLRIWRVRCRYQTFGSSWYR